MQINHKAQPVDIRQVIIDKLDAIQREQLEQRKLLEKVQAKFDEFCKSDIENNPDTTDVVNLKDHGAEDTKKKKS